MKLSDVKKLKVVELREKLKEMGLDSKGLKADLVARLWSALESQSDEEQLPDVDGSSITGRILLDIEEKQNTPEIQPDQKAEVNALIDTSVLPQRTPVLDISSGKGDDAATASQEIPSNSKDCAFKSNLVCMDYTVHTVKSVTRQDENEKVCLSSRTVSPDVVSEESLACQLTPKEVLNTTATMTDTANATRSTAKIGNPLSTYVVGEKKDTPGMSISLPKSQECIRLEQGHDRLKSVNAFTAPLQNQEEGQGKKRPLEEIVRDRSYYEFKEEVRYNRAKTPDANTVSEDEVDEDRVVLDSYNGDLHFKVGPDGMSGQPLLWERFPLLWSGCRLSHGVHSGKVSFEVKYVQRLVSSSQEEWRKLVAEPCVLRVGWSTDETSLQLGETEGSYAFDSRGRKVNKGRREDFGEPFSEGDVIGCYAWVKDSGQSELSFFKNGRPLGVAFKLPSSQLKGCVLYPHVLCKNCSVSLNLDPQGSPPWYQGPVGFTPLHALQPHQRSAAPRPPPSREECEVVLMVGLPGVGKSHWAQAHLAQHPEKRYTLLGTDAVMACMRTTEVESYAPRQLVLQQATQCVTELIREAAGRRGNYILDQANVYASARRHKMLLFSGFRRRAVVVFPSERDWHARRAQERGSAMTQENLLKIKVSFTLPEVGDLLEEVVFTERPREEAQRLLAAYKEEAREVLPTPPKRKKQKYKHKPNHCRPPAHGWKTWNMPHRRDPGWTGPPPPVPSPYWGPPPCTRQRTALIMLGLTEDMYDPMRPRNYYGCYGPQWNAFYGATAPFVDRSNTALAYW